MARSTEMIRQWETLRDIDAARTGIGIAKLAAARQVHQRTIRRDVEALSAAGFPLYDEKVNGSTQWRLNARPFRGLEDTGLSLTEPCALYFSRAMLAHMAGAPLHDDAERAFGKMERALPLPCRRFLDALPVMFKAKVTGRKKGDSRKVRELVHRALEASLRRRRVAARYDSHASRRTKDYILEPLRLSYVDGGVYLTAYVPEYAEARNFAVERIQTMEVLEETFSPRPLPVEPFANSLGAHSGPPEPVAIEFDAERAADVMAREWHRSQAFEVRADGSVLLRLEVCVDRPLTTWILGFGAAARVVAPARLAQSVLGQNRRGTRPLQAPAAVRDDADDCRGPLTAGGCRAFREAPVARVLTGAPPDK